MRNTQIFGGTSCPALTQQICENLGMARGHTELGQFANGETSVRILNSVREKDVFIVQSGSPKINDTIMELLIMIQACNGGSANKITAVLPYFPYSRQSKKKSHRGAITARMLANLLNVAGVKHVVTVDLHASQMQGFFKCPVDNLHAEPLIARWVRHNVPNWKEAVVVSKNAGGTKRVTSLADALKLNFGMVTTDRRRGNRMNTLSASLMMTQLDNIEQKIVVNTIRRASYVGRREGRDSSSPGPSTPTGTGHSSLKPPATANGGIPEGVEVPASATSDKSVSIAAEARVLGEGQVDGDDNDCAAPEVTHARLFQGHIVPDDFTSPALSTTEGSVVEDDPMAMSHVSSFFHAENHALGGSGGESDSEDEEESVKNSSLERMVTLVGDVRGRTVFIVDDMIDKSTSWVAAAETVVKRGRAKKVYCIATHGIFGDDCLAEMQACDCIDVIVVTNSYPIPPEQTRDITKLVVLDLSYLLAEAIRRNHYGESMSPLFQHVSE